MHSLSLIHKHNVRTVVFLQHQTSGSFRWSTVQTQVVDEQCEDETKIGVQVESQKSTLTRLGIKS